MRFVCRSIEIYLLTISCVFLWGKAQAQVTPDNTVDTTVNQNGNVAEITGGQTRGDNLFHSFQDFSVPTGNEAHFNNADTIKNIFSRVTGGNVSNIDGLIQAQGSASLFLVNPAGIIFGENASLNIGGSFIGSSADSILFPDDISFSASDTQAEPILTVNAPIGLGFRDNPGDIVNRSVANNFTGLTVPANETIALVGGNIEFDGGFIITPGSRIEIGSVADNSTVSLSQIDSGWSIGYEETIDFQDISFANAFVYGSGANTGDVVVRGRNVAVTKGSQVGILSSAGEAGNLTLIASESLEISGNGTKAGFEDFFAIAFNNISDSASGKNSKIDVATAKLSVTNGGNIATFNTNSNNQGVNIAISALEIILDGTNVFNADTPVLAGIYAQTEEAATGNGGTIAIDTDKLTVNNGAQINSSTFSAGNAGSLKVVASESVKLTGIDSNSNRASSLVANTRPRETEGVSTATGDGGDILVTTPELIVTDGAQIAATSTSQGTGGNVTLNVSESILLSGTAPEAELNRRTGITVSAAPFISTTGELIPTTGNAGSLSITANNLNIEQGAIVAASTFTSGDGGDATIDVNNLVISDGGQIRAGSLRFNDTADNELGVGGNIELTANSVLITGTGDINGDFVTSSLSTIAEGTGRAGDIAFVADSLTIEDGAEINASATGSGAAGNIAIGSQIASLDRGSIEAVTFAGEGGNITLSITDNLILSNESQISAEAREDANGGNIKIDSDLITAFPSQPDGSDIIAQAERGSGGNIEIFTESLLGIDQGEAIPGNENNDIDASSEFGLNGNVIIDVFDLRSTGELRELPVNVNVAGSVQTTAQACQADLSGEANTLVIEGKGGSVRPDEPLISTAILLEKDESAQKYESAEIQSFQTSRGKIIPAQGAKVTKDGHIILTSSRTDNSTRNYLGSHKCG